MSITSMSARAGMAQKLSIPQLQQAIQDGIIPPYVGVPLLQEKVKLAKTAQAAQAAQMAQQPNVTQQVMAEAQQVEQGVPALPTNLPAQMAGGGIVAFAEGGMYDDEDTDEDRLDASRQAEMDELMDEYAQTFQAGIGQLPAAAAVAPSNREGIASGDAADFVAKIMHKESRGRRYGRDGELLTSEKGAKGEMQVMPGTSRDPGFGVKPARDNSPDELARVGRDYAQTLLARYGDPKLAAIAYNMGPGATDKWLMAGADVSKLPKETQGYIRGFAHGGEVQHYDDGGLTFDPVTGMPVYDDIKREGLGDKFLRAINYNKGLTAGDTMPGMAKAKEQVAAALAARNAASTPSAKTETKPTTSPTTPSVKAPTAYDLASEADDQSFGATPRGDKQGAEVPAAGIAELQKPDRFAKFEDLFTKREENLAKQREQDKYMAMLQAGLGMMGGTSQHAFANIGAGATQGLQSLAQANAARTAEENALLSGRLGLEKIGANKEYQEEMMKYRRDLSAATDKRARDLASATAEEKKEARLLREKKEAGDLLNEMRGDATKRLLAKMKTQIIPGQEGIIEAQALEELKSDPAYIELYKKVYGMAPSGGKMSGGYGEPPAGAVKKI